jgi:hypothetical protein
MIQYLFDTENPNNRFFEFFLKIYITKLKTPRFLARVVEIFIQCLKSRKTIIGYR